MSSIAVGVVGSVVGALGAVGTAAAVGAGASLLGSGSISRATRDATEVSAESRAAAIAEQRRQYDQTRLDLSPFTEAGTDAIGGQMDLTGLNGPEAQRLAIEQLQQSPEFLSLVQQGEEGILQNASATGGLRGGNTQAALAQFRPQMLAQTIDRQYARLGGLTSVGQASAAQQANLGAQAAQNIGQIGIAQGDVAANAALARGQAQSAMFGNIAGAVGTAIGGIDFGGSGSAATSSSDGGFGGGFGVSGTF